MTIPSRILAFTFFLTASVAQAQTTAFTYQGRLQENGAGVTGVMDFEFRLFTAVSGGAPFGPVVTRNDLGITNGLFTVGLDFGAAPFDGGERFLDISVRPGASAGTYTNLAPRQLITATPYAIRAANLSGALPLSQLPAGVVTNNGGNVTLAGSFTGNGAALSNVNATTLGGLSSAGFWKTNGNAGANPTNGAFLGTTDKLPVEFRVNRARVLRLEPEAQGVIGLSSAPNVIGGWSGNQATNGAVGVTIWGGGSDVYGNVVGGDFGTVSGGRQNIAGGAEATVAGGRAHNARGLNATISGGYANTALGSYATVAGGTANTAVSDASAVSGGSQNVVQAGSTHTAIGGGFQNTIQTNAFAATIGGGANNTVRSNAYRGTVGGGVANTVGAAEGTVAGGAYNSALGFSSTVSGGGGNAVSGEWSVIAGGRDNVATNAAYATIGGGVQNVIQTNAGNATIGGGALNVIQINAFNSTIGGGRLNTVQTNTGDSTIGGGAANTIQSNSFTATIGGGSENTIRSNTWRGTIGGGSLNVVGAAEGTVAGGAYNSALGFSSTVGGGGGNVAGGEWSTIAGGRDNVATNAGYSTIGGGVQNTIQPNAFAATVPGGLLNSATNYGFAAGRRAKANHDGAFVWADATDADFVSKGTNQFLVRASGGVGINTNALNGAALAVHGNVTVNGTLTANGAGLTNLSITRMGTGAVGANQIRFTETAGSQQLYFRAAKNLDMETPNDATFWVGHDFIATMDHDTRLHVKHDADVTVDNNLTLTTYGNATMTVGQSLSTSVGASLTTSVGNSMSLSVGTDLSVTTGNRLAVVAPGGVGIGTSNPQANLHVYSANNPTVMRLQSAGTPGFGRLEFVSDPQGSGSEWRPGYIQAADNGGFTGGLSFVVNGTGFDNRFSEVEAMRIVNGRVGIGNSAPSTLLQVGGATCNGATWNNASDRNIKGNFEPVDGRQVLEKVAALAIQSWSYTNDLTARHVGPMAQDFRAAFGTGTDDKSIATVDADGVALAAIQGLNQKLEEKESRLHALEQELAALKELVAKLAKPRD